LITWTGTAFSPAKTSIQSKVSVVFHNANSAPFGSNVRISGTKPTSFTVTLDPGTSSKPVTFTATGNETIDGKETATLGDSSTATVTTTAAPQSPPPATHSPAASSAPSHGSGSTASPAPSSVPTAVTNPPPLGIGVIPTPSALPRGPDPLVAGPGFEDTPTPEPSSADIPAKALSQSVPARKYGLPGAVAAVLLTGVVVGVVRLARVEFGGVPVNGTSTEPTVVSGEDVPVESREELEN
jgi:hypothetical protein